ncbi:hypothetical protein KKA95_05085 [Patescibacteria group bacterium]|nr:hypothetical protein [Patescibacteria group bacterium]
MLLELAEDRPITKERKGDNLPANMAGFLEQFNENPEADKVGNEDPENVQRRVHYLLENAKRFEAEVKAFEEPFILLGASAEKKLVEAVGTMGETYVSKLIGYYDTLRKQVESIISNIRENGVAYLVNEKGVYNERAAEEIENLFDRMIYGFRELNEKVLDPLHPGHAGISIGTSKERGKTLSEYMEEVPEEQRGRRLNADSYEYEMEQARLDAIYKDLESGSDVTAENIRTRLFELTKNMLAHMSDDLAANSSSLLQKRIRRNPDGSRDRNLIAIQERPLAQLDFLLDVVIRSVRVVKNTRIQTEMLMHGRGMDELEQTSHSLPPVHKSLSTAG